MPRHRVRLAPRALLDLGSKLDLGEVRLHRGERTAWAHRVAPLQARWRQLGALGQLKLLPRTTCTCAGAALVGHGLHQADVYQ
jgi:hypothetical protein